MASSRTSSSVGRDAVVPDIAPTVRTLHFAEAAGLPYPEDVQLQLEEFIDWFEKPIPRRFEAARLSRIIATLQQIVQDQCAEQLDALYNIQTEFETWSNNELSEDDLNPATRANWIREAQDLLAPRSRHPRLVTTFDDDDDDYHTETDDDKKTEDEESVEYANDNALEYDESFVLESVAGSETHNLASTSGMTDLLKRIRVFVRTKLVPPVHNTSASSTAGMVDHVAEYERTRLIERHFKSIESYVLFMARERQKAYDAGAIVDLVYTTLYQLGDAIRADTASDAKTERFDRVHTLLTQMRAKLPMRLRGTVDDGGFLDWVEKQTTEQKAAQDAATTSATVAREAIAAEVNSIRHPDDLTFDNVCKRAVRRIDPDASDAHCTAVRQTLARCCAMRRHQAFAQYLNFDKDSFDYLESTLNNVPRSLDPRHSIPVRADLILDAECGLSIWAKLKVLRAACGSLAPQNVDITQKELDATFRGKTGQLSVRVFFGRGFLDRMTRHRIWNALTQNRRLELLSFYTRAMPVQFSPAMTLGLCTRRDAPLSNIGTAGDPRHPPIRLAPAASASASASASVSASASADNATLPDLIAAAAADATLQQQADAAAKAVAEAESDGKDNAGDAGVAGDAGDAADAKDADAGLQSVSTFTVGSNLTSTTDDTRTAEDFWRLRQPSAMLNMEAVEEAEETIEREDVNEADQHVIGDMNLIWNLESSWPAECHGAIVTSFSHLYDEAVGYYDREDFQALKVVSTVVLENNGASASASTSPPQSFQRVPATRGMETIFTAMGTQNATLRVTALDNMPMFDPNEIGAPTPKVGVSRVGMIVAPINGVFDDLRAEWTTRHAEIESQYARNFADGMGAAREVRDRARDALRDDLTVRMMNRYVLQLQAAIVSTTAIIDYVRLFQLVDDTHQLYEKTSLKLRRIVLAHRIARSAPGFEDDVHALTASRFTDRVCEFVDRCLTFYTWTETNTYAARVEAVRLARDALHVLRKALVPEQDIAAYCARHGFGDINLDTLRQRFFRLSSNPDRLTADQLPPLRHFPTVAFPIVSSLADRSVSPASIRSSYMLLQSWAARAFADLITAQAPLPAVVGTAAAATAADAAQDAKRQAWHAAIAPLRQHLVRRADGPTAINGAVVALPWLYPVTGHHTVARIMTRYANAVFLGEYPTDVYKHIRHDILKRYVRDCASPDMRLMLAEWRRMYEEQKRVMPRLVSVRAHLTTTPVSVVAPVRDSNDLRPTQIQAFLHSLAEHGAPTLTRETLAACVPGEDAFPRGGGVTTAGRVAEVSARREIREADDDRDADYASEGSGSDEELSVDEDQELERNAVQEDELGAFYNRNLVGERRVLRLRTVQDHLIEQNARFSTATLKKSRDVAFVYKEWWSRVDVERAIQPYPRLVPEYTKPDIEQNIAERMSVRIRMVRAYLAVRLGATEPVPGTDRSVVPAAELLTEVPPDLVAAANESILRFLEIRNVNFTPEFDTSPYYRQFMAARAIFSYEIRRLMPLIEQFQLQRPGTSLQTEGFRDILESTTVWYSAMAPLAVSALLDMEFSAKAAGTLLVVVDSVRQLSFTANNYRTGDRLRGVERRILRKYPGLTDEDSALLAYIRAEATAAENAGTSADAHIAAQEARAHLIATASTELDADFVAEFKPSFDREMRAAAAERRRYEAAAAGQSSSDDEDDDVLLLDLINRPEKKPRRRAAIGTRDDDSADESYGTDEDAEAEADAEEEAEAEAEAEAAAEAVGFEDEDDSDGDIYDPDLLVEYSDDKQNGAEAAVAAVNPYAANVEESTSEAPMPEADDAVPYSPAPAPAFRMLLTQPSTLSMQRFNRKYGGSQN